MRIVDVSAFYAPLGGGVRNYIDQKLAAAPAAGHDLTVIAPGSRSWTEQRGPGARIVWLRSPRFPLDPNYHYFGDAAALHAELDRARPEVVEVSSPWRSASMVAAWPGAAARTLVMHADPLAAYAYRWLEMLADRPTIDRGFDWYWRHLRRLDANFGSVISASRSLSQRLVAGGLRNVSTIPMGVEPGLFSPARRDPSLRRHLLALCQLGPDATLLIGVGRQAPEKRWPMIVDAVTAAQFSAPVGLVLVGSGRERGRIVSRIGNNPHIRLLGRTRDRAGLARLMASADALIHGCEAETFCMVAAEAMASGLDLIVPSDGGAFDQLDAARGWSFTPGSAADAARQIAACVKARAATTIRPTPTNRTMQDHFDELFASYERLIRPMRTAA